MFNPNLEWEPLNSSSDTYRMKVHGGWMYRFTETSFNTIIMEHGHEKRDYVDRSIIQFIPDEHHVWLKKEALKHLLTNGGNG